MRQILVRFASDESGATAIEYAMIAAIIGLAIITVATNVGTEVSSVFTEVETGLKGRK